MAQEYRKVGTETRYRTEHRVVEQDFGFEDIPICRPKFVAFEFTGLKPNTPHWIFLDKTDVTKYVNTSFTIDSYNNSSRNSVFRAPGDIYTEETQFPAAQGGPTNASGPVNSAADGSLSGILYIQSNETLNFPTGVKLITAIDISVLDKTKCLSYGQTEFVAHGLYELYTEVEQQVTVAYEADIFDWVTVPNPPPPAVSYSNNDNDNGPPLFYSHYEPDTQTVTKFKGGVTSEELRRRRNATKNRLFDHGSNNGGSNSSQSESSGGGCCFIMLEARYGNGTMDKVVRRYRDEYMTDRNRRGYYRLAEVLVPLMRKSKLFKWVVTKTFADPLVAYGKYYYGENKYGIIFTPVKNFWMKVFDVVGGETKFIRENGEVV